MASVKQEARLFCEENFRYLLFIGRIVILSRELGYMEISIVNRIDIHLFCFFICLVILTDMRAQYVHPQYSFRIFRFLLIGCMLILVMESISWFLEGRKAQQAIFLFDTVYFAVQPVIPFLWSLYVEWQIEWSEYRVRRCFSQMLVPIAVAELSLLLNLFYPFIFTVDSAGFYQRSWGFYFFMFCSYACMGYALFRIINKRHSLEAAKLRPLLLFYLPPLVGGLLQAFLYGVSLVWPGITLSLLIVYIYIQNRRLSTDYLTGAYNRMQMDMHLRRKIVDAGRHSFSAILLDVDKFKEINDRYGHTVGDQMLIATVNLLKRSLHKDDFLARYGGDEFLVVIDTEDVRELQRTVERIRKNLALFNKSNTRPCKLNLSMGYDIYDPGRKLTMEQFLQHIDGKMYKNKNNDNHFY